MWDNKKKLPKAITRHAPGYAGHVKKECKRMPKNKNFLHSHLKNSTLFIILFADPARVVFTPTVQYIPRGLKGIIRCETDANPPITYITWKKDSRLFDPFNNAGIMALLNGSLLIDQVSIIIILSLISFLVFFKYYFIFPFMRMK